MTPVHLATVSPPAPHPVRRLLAPAEVAERLAVSRSMVYKLLRNNELSAVYVGRLPRIAEIDLDAYISRGREDRGR